MKNLFTLITLLSTLIAYSQTTMNIYENDGTVLHIPISIIDSITYTVGGNACSGTTAVTDFDGNTYNVVEIGNQCWMKENLKTTHYRNGAAIPTGSGSGPKYSVFDTIYGNLYNYYVVNTGELCPFGWHIPTDAEWQTIIEYLGDSTVAGAAMKDTILWGGQGATNSSGFSALPGGFQTGGGFGGSTSAAYFWSSTLVTGSYARLRYISALFSSVFRSSGNMNDKYSCRCVKD